MKIEGNIPVAVNAETVEREKRITTESNAESVNVKKDTLSLQHVKDVELSTLVSSHYDKCKYAMDLFVHGNISVDEMKNRLAGVIRDVYSIKIENGLEEGKEVGFLNSWYLSLRNSAIWISEGANLVEGREIAHEYGIGRNNFVYYNAKYYYVCEQITRTLGECMNEFAEEKSLGELHNEEYYTKNTKPGFNFNSLCMCTYTNVEMINTEVDPPKDFVFFCGKNWETEEEIFYVNDISLRSDSAKNETVLQDGRESKPPLNMLDYAKRLFSGEDVMWDTFHFLKNFRICSLKRLYMAY